MPSFLRLGICCNQSEVVPFSCQESQESFSFKDSPILWSHSEANMDAIGLDLKEICDNTKLAREMALLGNYDSASVYYQGVIQQIHKLLGTITDSTRRMRWQQVSLSMDVVKC